MKTKILLGMALVAASSSALAVVDNTSSVTSLTDATNVLTQCSVVAKNIAAVKPPPNHLEAREAERFNRALIEENEKAQLAKAPGVKPTAINPALLKAHPPEYQAFLNNMRTARRDLQQCGEAYTRANAQNRPMVKKVSDQLADPKRKRGDNDRSLADAVLGYLKASEDLSSDINALAKNEALSPYFIRTIEKNFLGKTVPTTE